MNYSDLKTKALKTGNDAADVASNYHRKPPDKTPDPTENVTPKNMPTYHSGMAIKTGKTLTLIHLGSAHSIFDSWEAITAASKISGISAT